MVNRIVLCWRGGLWWKWHPQFAEVPALRQQMILTEPPRTEPSRTYQRSLSSLEASCHPISAARDDPWPAQVHDLSPAGIGLLIKRRFEPGTLLAVELQSISLSFSRTLVARVIHARSQGGGDWVIGCTLASRLDEDELEALHV